MSNHEALEIEQQQAQISSFTSYLVAERGLSHNTIEGYKSDLDSLVKFLISKKQSLTTCPPVALTKYFEEVDIPQKENIGLEASSQLRKISAFNHFFQFLQHEAIRPDNPAENIIRPKSGKNLPAFFTESQMEAILSIAKQDKTKSGIRGYAILELIYSAGLRVTECLTIKIESIMYRNKLRNEITIQGKGSQERIVFINKDSQNALKRYLSMRTCFLEESRGRPHRTPQKSNSKAIKNEYVFCSGSSHYSRKSFYCYFKNIVNKAVRECDQYMPHNPSPHKIRHSFATHMFARGIDLMILKDLLGHADISTTEIYTHTTSKDLSDTVNKHHPLSGKNL